MPEGDTIFRAARTLHRALAGRVVTGFESIFPALTRVDHDQPLRGRTVERVNARGKHLLMSFSGDLVLRTHMRMHGSWHLYRPGDRWRRPRHEMRIRVATEAFEAVAFSVPVAELLSSGDMDRHEQLRALGPDLLSPSFDAPVAVARLAARPEEEIGEALLDQRALAGIGNIYKSESLFAAGVNPFVRVGELPAERLAGIVAAARRLLSASGEGTRAPMWVYSRAGRPCRRCGTPISARRQGAHARWTWWCARCQPR